ncbi:MAG: hypothetical protein JEY94_00050 [Melioribacteraceae bacterium]|nr:hypothetical protein [Melioribacteraceae bacterium]
MSTSKRKIGFYSIKIERQTNESSNIDSKVISTLIKEINKLDENERIYDIKKSNKFHFLNSQTKNKNIINIVFASAKYHHRPPLIDKDTGDRRDNPKSLTEGELESTHISLKILDDEIVVLMEERQVGVAIGSFVSYLKIYINRLLKTKKTSYTLSYSVIPKGNFLEELEKLKRIRLGNIYVEKQLLGSEYLNYSNRLEQVQDDLILTIKAKRNRSIKDNIREFSNLFFTEGERISKIRVYGESEEGNKILLDTDLVKMIEYLEAEVDDTTGIVDSATIFLKLNKILKGYEVD